MKLYSYVVHHDYGFAPNPHHGYCTLAHCKFSKDGRTPNIVERAKPKDWVVGTGGANLKLSAGHGRLIYAMRVTEKLSLAEYLRDPRFRLKRPEYGDQFGDNLVEEAMFRRFVLISDDFFYFGRSAPKIPVMFQEVKAPGANKSSSLEERGPGFRADFSPVFIANFVQWLRSKRKGVQGVPCALVPHRVRGFCQKTR